MGNCLKLESSAVWGGEDWSFVETDTKEEDRRRCARAKEAARKNESENRIECLEAARQSLQRGCETKKIKVKIKKTELEELVKIVEGQGFPNEELLAELVSRSDQQKADIPCCKSALKCITENDCEL